MNVADFTESPASGDEATVAGVTYTVFQVLPDPTGGVSLSLRERREVPMPSVRVYQKKQIRLDRLNFAQTQMFKVGNVGVAAVEKNLIAAASHGVCAW